ncbi:hypothetical protein SARC_17410, partial [Sphaeroforma arctica JP610]
STYEAGERSTGGYEGHQVVCLGEAFPGYPGPCENGGVECAPTNPVLWCRYESLSCG